MPREGNAPPTPCPSEHAYRRHLYRGEEPCEGCKEAHHDYGAQRRPLAGSVSGVHVGEKPLGPGDCGSLRGYRWHRKNGEPTCQVCRDAVAQDRRSRYGKATGTQPNRTIASCGTPAAYARHLMHGETPCEACQAAHTEYNRVDYLTRRTLAAMAREVPDVS